MRLDETPGAVEVVLVKRQRLGRSMSRRVGPRCAPPEVESRDERFHGPSPGFELDGSGRAAGEVTLEQLPQALSRVVVEANAVARSRSGSARERLPEVLKVREHGRHLDGLARDR